MCFSQVSVKIPAIRQTSNLRSNSIVSHHFQRVLSSIFIRYYKTHIVRPSSASEEDECCLYCYYKSQQFSIENQHLSIENQNNPIENQKASLENQRSSTRIKYFQATWEDPESELLLTKWFSILLNSINYDRKIRIHPLKNLKKYLLELSDTISRF